ncbi:MAG: LacI family DNA-binding transcriptional regulator [Chloroflexi bacterium]|nr:LacI family DNA-binding transcriptional regulator [Chloroflexota bacterium]
MTTIKDIADHVGVSFKTVSRVLNNHPSVSEETRTRVWAAVQELGYRPNAAARSMRTGKSHTIGFITDSIATRPHAGNVILGAQHEAWQHGRLLLVVNTEQDPTMEEEAISMMLERQVDAIIYAAWYHRPVSPPPMIKGVPCVLVDCFVEDYSISSVVPDEVRGGREATEQLLKNGHHRVGFINNEDKIPATFGRLQGYRAALTAHGIDFDKELVIEGQSDSSNGYECAQHLLSLSDPPTALFCFNDQMAMGAYEAVKERGLGIPEDIAIIGFDNLELIAATLRPSLTTMQLPHYEMGRWAVDYLMGIVDGDQERLPVHEKLECPLVARQSVT